MRNSLLTLGKNVRPIPFLLSLERCQLHQGRVRSVNVSRLESRTQGLLMASHYRSQNTTFDESESVRVNTGKKSEISQVDKA